MTPRTTRAKDSSTAKQPTPDSDVNQATNEKSGVKQPANEKSASADAHEAARSGGDQAVGADRQRSIREAAYRRFEARGRVHGRDLEDWLEAEAELASGRQRSREIKQGT